MRHLPLSAAVLFGLVVTPLLAASLSKLPTMTTSELTWVVTDNRTDVERLQADVAALQLSLTSAQQQIQQLQDQVNVQGDLLLAQDQDLLTLSGAIQVTSGKVTINTSTLEVTAATSKFSGTVDCAKLTTKSVVSDSYTPGAGNIW